MSHYTKPGDLTQYREQGRKKDTHCRVVVGLSYRPAHLAVMGQHGQRTRSVLVRGWLRALCHCLHSGCGSWQSQTPPAQHSQLEDAQAGV